MLSSVFAQGPKEWGERCFVETTQAGKVATIQGLECVFANIVSIVIPCLLYTSDAADE